MDRKKIIGRFEPKKENLLSILHDLQNSNPEHFISEEDMKDVAAYLNISRSSVFGVVTYYSMFSRSPRGRNIIRVCSSPVCRMTGAVSIIDDMEVILGIEPGETTPDKLFTLETTECIGRCDESPGMTINDEFYGNLTRTRLLEIIEHYRAGLK